MIVTRDDVGDVLEDGGVRRAAKPNSGKEGTNYDVAGEGTGEDTIDVAIGKRPRKVHLGKETHLFGDSVEVLFGVVGMHCEVREGNNHIA